MTINKYIYPVEIPDPKIIQYSASPAHKERLRHAVDFIVPEGTPIRAAFDGTVADVKQDSDIGGEDENFDSQGNYIEIRHDNDEYSIYEHIRKDGSLVKIRDSVRKGQLIGYSGNTGWMADLGPHLHFDVHRYFGRGLEDYETMEIGWENKI